MIGAALFMFGIKVAASLVLFLAMVLMLWWAADSGPPPVPLSYRLARVGLALLTAVPCAIGAIMWLWGY